MFSRLVEIVLARLHWTTCLVYLDNIIVCGKTFEDMVKNLGEVCERLQEAGLKLKARKCQLFAKKKVEFLRHIILEEGISTDPSKKSVLKTGRCPKRERSTVFPGNMSLLQKIYIQGLRDR